MTSAVLGKKAFDTLAVEYDRLNVTNPCIRYIREKFRETVVAQTPGTQTLRCLDIGCGTGEDALYFTERGWEVVGIDESEEMIRTARRKKTESRRVRFLVQDFNHLTSETFSGETFDIIFSNFGALNCLTDLGEFSKLLFWYLKSGGILAFNILGKFYPFEIFNFGLKGKWSVALRRLRKKANARIGEQMIPVVYWSPGKFIKIFGNSGFELISYSSIAWLVPAPYYYDGNPQARVPGWLTDLDFFLGRRFPFNHWGDHTFYFFRKIGK